MLSSPGDRDIKWTFKDEKKIVQLFGWSKEYLDDQLHI